MEPANRSGRVLFSPLVARSDTKLGGGEDLNTRDTGAGLGFLDYQAERSGFDKGKAHDALMPDCGSASNSIVVPLFKDCYGESLDTLAETDQLLHKDAVELDFAAEVYLKPCSSNTVIR